ncbi:MAG: hypothetical protein KDD84_15130 [Caldilineaceae bacterium]|nr:hypothetical protein [Caldilineaceae bacterium]
MQSLSIRLGYWSALVAVLTFVVYTVCFVVILATGPVFLWTDFDAYLLYTQQYHSFWPELGRLSMIVFGLSFVVVLAAVEDVTAGETKFLARLGLLFGLAAVTLTGAFYFVQISAVRLNLAQGAVTGLEQVIQGNPYSAFAALNMMGWTVLLGLSSLFVAPAFRGGRAAAVTRWAFLVNGVSCLIGALGYIFNIFVVVLVTMNLVLGGALITAMVGVAVWLKRR